MSVLGLIPARAGSQRLPRKNLAELGGAPLIEWTINAAHLALLFDHIVISTDDSDVAALGRECGCEVLIRPPELARADTQMLPVVKHALEKYPADEIVLLQPTSPLRTHDDIYTAYQQLVQLKADSIISVTAAPQALAFEIAHANRLREAKNIVVPNGALYLVTSEHLRMGGDWYDGVAYAYFMPKERSVDIDSQVDLELARLLIGKKQAA